MARHEASRRARSMGWRLALAAALAATGVGARAAQPEREALLRVWPYRGVRHADGTLEYWYDLRPAKRASALSDAFAAYAESEVRGFLAELPPEARVRLEGPGAVTLALGRGPDTVPLAPSFAKMSTGPILLEEPLSRGPDARLRPPLHALMPKPLVGAAAALFGARQLEEGAVAAIELDAEPAWRRVLARLGAAAVARARSTSGDARAGALVLAARAAAAQRCLEPSALAAQLAGAKAEEQDDAVLRELEALRAAAVAAPQTRWLGGAARGCGRLRAHALSLPFADERAGVAAPLVFLTLLEADPALARDWAALRRLQDATRGAPASEPLESWRSAAKGAPAAAIERMSEFLEGLPQEARVPPGLLPVPAPPFRRVLGQIALAERGSDVDELVAAVEDGRFNALARLERWPDAREAALAALVSEAEPAAEVRLEASWRTSLTGAFAWLQGANPTGIEPFEPVDPPAQERSRLKVRLVAPPLVEVEPLPWVYRKAAASLERLDALVTAERLGHLRAVRSDGGRAPEPLSREVPRAALVLRGLAALAAPRLDTPLVDRGAVAAARAFLARRDEDPYLTQDVRVVAVAPAAGDGRREHVGVAGVGRMELAVRFAAPPKRAVVTSRPGYESFFEVDAEAAQRYLVPRAVTVAAEAPGAVQPLSPATLRALVDGVGRDPVRAQDAFRERLGAISPP